jgi:hypothetical protein
MMNWKSKSSLAPSFILAFVLACGANMAWLIMCVICFAVGESWFPNIQPGREGFAALFPSPLLLAWVDFFVTPVTAIREAHATDYFAGLAYYSTSIITTMLFACALSTILAILCFRRHLRYSDRNAVAWALFVFVLGIPGFIGYLLHRRWPIVVRCQHCGVETPRDRDTCLTCSTPFPPPAMKGIEVFA